MLGNRMNDNVNDKGKILGSVIPAQAGIQSVHAAQYSWIPACAGMTQRFYSEVAISTVAFDIHALALRQIAYSANCAHNGKH